MITRICAQLVRVAVSGVSGTSSVLLQRRGHNNARLGSFEAYCDIALDIGWLADANHSPARSHHAVNNARATPPRPVMIFNWTSPLIPAERSGIAVKSPGQAGFRG